MKPDKETNQSLSRGLEKRKRNGMVFEGSLERMGVWWNNGMVSCMVLAVWMLGSAAGKKEPGLVLPNQGEGTARKWVVVRHQQMKGLGELGVFGGLQQLGKIWYKGSSKFSGESVNQEISSGTQESTWGSHMVTGAAAGPLAQDWAPAALWGLKAEPSPHDFCPSAPAQGPAHLPLAMSTPSSALKAQGRAVRCQTRIQAELCCCALLKAAGPGVNRIELT